MVRKISLFFLHPCCHSVLFFRPVRGLYHVCHSGAAQVQRLLSALLLNAAASYINTHRLNWDFSCGGRWLSGLRVVIGVCVCFAFSCEIAATIQFKLKLCIFVSIMHLWLLQRKTLSAIINRFVWFRSRERLGIK